MEVAPQPLLAGSFLEFDRPSLVYQPSEIFEKDTVIVVLTRISSDKF